MEGSLLNRVKVEDSMWSVDKASHHIFINLEKQKETMWKSVFQGEEGIDLTKVDTTRDISDFDQEAQAAIQRVTFDHQMKMMGKPTSSEQVSLNFPPLQSSLLTFLFTESARHLTQGMGRSRISIQRHTIRSNTSEHCRRLVN